MKRTIVLLLTTLCLLIGGNPADDIIDTFYGNDIVFELLLFLWATIATETSKVSYSTTPGLTAYPYTFKIFSATDLAVIVRDSVGAEHTQALGTQYTVSGVGNNAGGTVTFLAAPYVTYGAGSKVIIYSDVPCTQETDFLEGGRFSAETLEGVLDKNTRLIQQSKTNADRTIKFPISSAANSEMPDPAVHPGKYLRYNSSGARIEAVDLGGTGLTINLHKLSDYATLSAMLAAIGSADATVYVDSVGTLTADTVFPSTLHVIMLKGGALTLGNYNLAINGPFEAFRGQVFNYTGAGRVSGLTEARPEWWGVDGTADDVQIGYAQSALVANGVLKLPGTYHIASALTITVPIDASLHRLFTGPGAVTFNPGVTAYPEWWGAVRDGNTDCTAAIQAAIDASAGAIRVCLGPGTYKTTGTIYLRRNEVRIVGSGPGVTLVKFVNAAGGVMFAGDTATYNSTNTYTSCALEGFEVLSSGSASTDASIVVDLTSFSYGKFNIEAQTRRNGGVIYYGQGNSGTSPYYNHIESTGLGGGADCTQTAFQFRGGAWAGGSNGPNANMIGPITRALSLDKVFDIRVGQGNMFVGVGAESIAGGCIVVGGGSAAATGRSSGSNSGITLNDTTKTWSSNQFIGGAVRIDGGTGAGQIRRIALNTATAIQTTEPWGKIPDATSVYSVYVLKASGNKFVNVRQEGSSSSNFIYAHPDSDGTEVSQAAVQSVGQFATDNSCASNNKLFGPTQTLITYTFVNPGASANLQAWPRHDGLGGMRLAGQYVLHWVKAECMWPFHGATATVTVDCGGTATGGGSPSLSLALPVGESQGAAWAVGVQEPKSGTNNSLFLNLQTPAGFYLLEASVTVTICVTLL